ncbi:hypothetical protein E2C01_070951 [Portunus trituberculatus]|uniref:Uncharacterized protein n=1 Tax=Portunus trituberculatus TaxID=210409 RepID=A0A5B7I6U2_PORTR|nr:hypothetical protein [Portunus trituberculatus]
MKVIDDDGGEERVGFNETWEEKKEEEEEEETRTKTKRMTKTTITASTKRNSMSNKRQCKNPTSGIPRLLASSTTL